MSYHAQYHFHILAKTESLTFLKKKVAEETKYTSTKPLQYQLEKVTPKLYQFKK